MRGGWKAPLRNAARYSVLASPRLKDDERIGARSKDPALTVVGLRYTGPEGPLQFTLPIGVRYFQLLGSQGGEPMIQLLMAASLMMTLPRILLFFAGQQYFVRGVAMSGLAA